MSTSTPGGITHIARAASAKQDQLPSAGATSGARRKFATRKIVLGSLIPVVVLTVWQLASALEWLDPLMFPAPSAIARVFYETLVSGELWYNFEISVFRALLGFLIGGGLGLLLGLTVGMSKTAEEIVDPTVQMVRSIPLLAITPLFILWFGFGELSKVLLISLGSFIPLYVNSFLGVRNVDSRLFDVARVLEFNKWKKVTRLVLPAAMPNVLLGMRLSISISWLVLVVAELMGSDRGVGYMIQDARSFMRTEVVFLGILLFAAVGKLSDSLVRYLEKRLLKWQDSYKG